MFRTLTVAVFALAIWLIVEYYANDTTGIVELARPLPSLITIQDLPTWETQAEYEARIHREILKEKARKYWYVQVFYIFIP